jgi:hypothetical protein
VSKNFKNVLNDVQILNRSLSRSKQPNVYNVYNVMNIWVQSCAQLFSRGLQFEEVIWHNFERKTKNGTIRKVL